MEAVDALLEATPETPSYMIGMHENKITRVPLVEAVKMVFNFNLELEIKQLTSDTKTQSVATAIKDKDFEKAMSLRDPEFCEGLEGFISVSSLDSTKRLPKDQVSMILPYCWNVAYRTLTH